MRLRRAAPLALLLVLAVAAEAAAQSEAYCIDPYTRSLDPRSTAALRQAMQQPDPQVMQALAGTWYVERRSPTGQVGQQYWTFEPNGLFQYRDRTCSPATGVCSDNQGAGMIGVQGTGNGTYSGVMMISDMNRNHQCLPTGGRFVDSGTMVGSDGTPWRRVR